MGIRCESDTVPATVSLVRFIRMAVITSKYHCPLSGGKVNDSTQVRRPAIFDTNIEWTFGKEVFLNMERKYKFLVVLGLLLVAVGYGQSDDQTIVLDEVVLSDARLRHFSKASKVSVISDSIIQKSGASLTDVLRNNSNIYFKENGYGMVSSPSFRGTNAQQTAVIWNGISINSQLTGQTDFNTLIPLDYNDITVRSGGGSVQYGSGAVGGSVLLNDSFSFNGGWKHRLLSGYGSFNTGRLAYHTTYGKEKLSFKLGVDHIASDNDYKYLGTDRRNGNGAYKHLNLSGSLGYILSDHHILKIYHNSYIGDRDFSGTLTAATNENYRDFNTRSLIELGNFNSHKIERLKLAHLYERYRYYPNRSRDNFSYGQAHTFIANYDYKYRLDRITLNGIVDLSKVNATGTSIENADRDQLSGTFLFSHDISDKINYGLNLRKEWVSDYDSPFLFSLDGRYRATKNYTLTLNASKNYRVPTFNDLYWTGAGARGNPEVLPETSWQLEIGQALAHGQFHFSANAYTIISDDLIQWRPDTLGVWMAMNVQDVSQYGLELDLNWEKKWEHRKLLWENGYTYTRSVDNFTKNQLMYVPEHRLRSNLAFQYKRVTVFYRMLYTGPVYITTDKKNWLPGHLIADMGADYRWPITSKIQVDLGLKVNNLFNKNYQNVAYRPMPNRNFQFQINTKF